MIYLICGLITISLCLACYYIKLAFNLIDDELDRLDKEVLELRKIIEMHLIRSKLDDIEIKQYQQKDK